MCDELMYNAFNGWLRTLPFYLQWNLGHFRDVKSIRPRYFFVSCTVILFRLVFIKKFGFLFLLFIYFFFFCSRAFCYGRLQYIQRILQIFGNWPSANFNSSV